MSEWTWSLLNFLQAAALALLHDEETVGLPAGLGLHREALHHVPRHAQVLHLDTGKLARLLYNGMALTHRYTALWQWPLTTISWYAHTATHLNSFHGYSPGITGSTECFHHSFSNFFPEQIQNIQYLNISIVQFNGNLKSTKLYIETYQIGTNSIKDTSYHRW